jgi:hypothetical protein
MAASGVTTVVPGESSREGLVATARPGPSPTSRPMKNIILLSIGIAFGYSVGFKDARQNDKNVVSRLVDRVGGSNRGKYNDNVDKTMKEAEK